MAGAVAEGVDHSAGVGVVGIAYPEAHQVVISFTNNGPIIPPELLPYIFEPFFTTKPDGSGLGLWVNHSLLQQYDGVLTVENLGSTQGVVFT